MTRPDPTMHLTAAGGPRTGTCPAGHKALLFDMVVLTDTGVSEPILGAAVFCTICTAEENQ